jgi:hypothetical protein
LIRLENGEHSRFLFLNERKAPLSIDGAQKLMSGLARPPGFHFRSMPRCFGARLATRWQGRQIWPVVLIVLGACPLDLGKRFEEQKPSASAKRAKAACCVSSPSSNRPCFCVETRI